MRQVPSSRRVYESVYVIGKTGQAFDYPSGLIMRGESFDSKIVRHPAEKVLRIQGRAWISQAFLVSFFFFGDLPKGVGHDEDTDAKKGKREVVFA